MRKALITVAISCLSGIYSQAQIKQDWKMKPVGIKTRWSGDVKPDNVFPEYPRPQMVRNEWSNLNGLWEYKITSKEAVQPENFDGRILVPYPVESALSGVQKELLPSQKLWYKRTFSKPPKIGSDRLILHFGAVDWKATVYINGKQIGSHQGGYQNFSFDITNDMKEGDNELVVEVFDPSNKGINPHGKQVLNPQNILYTASSGIWQTVWLEKVPSVYISNIFTTPNLDSSFLRVLVNTNKQGKDYTIEAIASNGNSIKGKIGDQLRLPVPNTHVWSPEDPYLYNLSVRLLYKGKIVDTVGSYFGMRKIEVKKDEKGIERLFLNNRYQYHLGVLDQGFWPEGLYTAPTDEALKFDMLAIKNIGFNTIRKHVKLEPARWYYYADKIGMLVWQDMVTCAGNSEEAHAEFEKENIENITQLHNYPSIVIWVLFNEGWARYDQQRLTEWVKSADPSRVIDGHTGENYDRESPQNPYDKWAGSDLTDIHDYPGPGIAPYLPGKARVLGEWGGVRVPIPQHQWNGNNGWGYIQVNAGDFAERYQFMLKHLKIYEEEGLSGSIYTEPFDVETEENGLITYDREVIKIPAEKLRNFNSILLPQAVSYATMTGQLKFKDADTSNPEKQYAAAYQEYKTGKRDSGFLYNLVQMANQVNDKEHLSTLAGEYINTLKNPFHKPNLEFIQLYTRKSSDPGFRIFVNNGQKVDSIMGEGTTANQIKLIIFKDEIEPYLAANKYTPNWDSLENSITKRYGTPGEEILWRAKAFHYYNNREWNKFVISADPYFKKYGNNVAPFELNNFAWNVFLHVTDHKLLSAALLWTKASLQREENPYILDTYANLLYKLGRKDEAIPVEEKAINLAPNEQKKDLQVTLNKMKNGENTWQ